MKKTLALALPILILGISSAEAQIISGQQLNMGTAGATNNTVTGTNTGSIGASNQQLSNNGLVVGSTNKLQYGDNSLVAGHNNTQLAPNSITIGAYNNNTQQSTLMLGESNNFSNSSGTYNNIYAGSSNTGAGNSNVAVVGSNYSSISYSGNSLVTGYSHTVNSIYNALVAGETNVANGKQFVLGTGLIAQDTTQAAVVLGQYNKTIPPVAGSPKPVLVVGTGTSSATANRSNALEVYTDGSVKLGRLQGDISGGEFVP